MSGFDDDSLTSPPAGAVEASTAEGGTSPAVGRDEWVARHGQNRFRRGGMLGRIEERLAVVPWWAWLTLFVALVALLPVGFESGYVRRVAFDTVVYMLLALGLNVVVGWGGLLDLGFVAFYGIGAYTYAVLNSDKYDIHLGALPTMFVVLAIGATAGFLVGLPSRRLSGDYLAIVTLFFLQIFLTVTINSDGIRGHNLLGGPNGVLNVDPLTFFGHELKVSTEGVFNVAYLYVALAVFVVVYVALRFVNHSRTGRAWRSLREDPLAAELMGMPVNWLKLMSFAFGAAVAALTGVLFASLNSSVFPLSFSFPLVITVYTMVILGGFGQPGRRRARRDPDQRDAGVPARPGRRAEAVLRRRRAGDPGCVPVLVASCGRPRRHDRVRGGGALRCEGDRPLVGERHARGRRRFRRPRQ